MSPLMSKRGLSAWLTPARLRCTQVAFEVQYFSNEPEYPRLKWVRRPLKSSSAYGFAVTTPFWNSASTDESVSVWIPESHKPPIDAPGVNTQPAVLRVSRWKGDGCASAALLTNPSRQSAMRMRDIEQVSWACAPATVPPRRTLLRDDDRVARLQIYRLNLALECLAVVEGDGFGARAVHAEDAHLASVGELTRSAGSGERLQYGCATGHDLCARAQDFADDVHLRRHRFLHDHSDDRIGYVF